MARHQLIVLDMEFTAWEGSLARDWGAPGEFPELVQIGGVCVRLESGLPEIAAFETLVRPVLSPRLSRYFMDLTGIRQKDVDRAAEFRPALRRFLAFCEPAAASLSNGVDHAMLARSDRLHGTDFADRLPPARNVRPMIGAFLSRDPESFSSGELPELFGLAEQGAAHQALADSRAVAAALRAIIDDHRQGPEAGLQAFGAALGITD